MIFYYVRHGEPIYNPDSLTEYGAQQAEALAKRFALYGLDEVYASSSTRAVQTAQPTCRLLKKEPVLLDWAHESLAWSELTLERNGRNVWLFQDRESLAKMRSKETGASGDDFLDDPYFPGPKIKDGLKRIREESDAFFLKLGFRHNREKCCYEVLHPNAKRVAFFAHQGFGLAFLSTLLDIPYSTFASIFDMGHSGVTVIYFDERKEICYPKVLQLSNDSHLYKEEILKGYQNWIDI